MFSNNAVKFYTQILNADSDARQIRTRKNRVFATNKAGADLFGLGENPFAFLKNATEPERIQKIGGRLLFICSVGNRNRNNNENVSDYINQRSKTHFNNGHGYLGQQGDLLFPHQSIGFYFGCVKRFYKPIVFNG